MPVNVDLFLRRYFRENERRSSPAPCSMDVGGGALTREERADRQTWYVWAVTVIGRLERRGDLTERSVGVLRAVYLRLGNVHSTTWSESGAVDVQSWVSWRAVARVCGVADGRTAARWWRDARANVQRELDEHEERG